MAWPRARRAAAWVLLGGAAAAGVARAAPGEATLPPPAAATVPAGAAPAEAAAATVPSPSPARAQRLLHMVRQDCGSCHGMRMTGGLGPALTPEALAGKPVASLAATIYHGRPGTPMPGWRSMLTADEAHWIAQQLLDGLPDQAR